MKIALINASPKRKDSASACLLADFKTFLPKETEILELFFRQPLLEESVPQKLLDCDALLFAFPLYLDGLPSHLIANLLELEAFFRENLQHKISVYAIANNGFYEAEQNALALEMMHNWCAKAGLSWGEGLGVGAGGMLHSVKNLPVGKGYKKDLAPAMQSLATQLLRCAGAEDLFTTLSIPRNLYQRAAQLGWRAQLLKNGLRLKDLDRQCSLHDCAGK